MNIRISIFLLFFLVLLNACRKEDTTITTNQNIPEPKASIETVIQGIIANDLNEPLSAVTVNLNGSTVTTDENGVFFINGKTAKDRAILQIEHDGYFRQTHVTAPFTEDTARTYIILKEREPLKTIQSTQGGILEFNNQASINLAADGFETLDGAPYSGDVILYAQYLDPTDPQIGERMPGDYLAINTSGEERVLESFGMVNLEMESPSGEAIQINKPATITMDVPNAIRSAAPSTIPLWYFDEASGYWLEEGEATLVNGQYIGEVSHFTWWNCDAPFPVVELTGRVIVSEFAPIVTVRITRSSGPSRTTKTNSHGGFLGKVPANEILLLEIINSCGEVIHSQNVGPLTDDTDLGIISLDPSLWVQVRGQVENCAGDPVTNGYVSVRQLSAGSSGQIIPTASNGSFLDFIPNCSGADFSVFAYDIDSSKLSDAVVYPYASPMDFGTIAVCDQTITAQMVVIFNGTEYVIDNAIATLDPTTGAQIMNIRCLDAQAPQPDKVIYDWTILNWTPGSGTPNWTFTGQHQLINSPDPVFKMESGTINVVNDTVIPGEFFIVEMNGEIENTATGEKSNGSIRLTAIVQ